LTFICQDLFEVYFLYAIQKAVAMQRITVATSIKDIPALMLIFYRHASLAHV